MSQSTTDAPRHSRKGLIVPFVIAGMALAFWTGWWFYLAHQVESRLEARVASIRQAGWTVKYDRKATAGWPLHTRVTLDNLEVIAPNGQGVRTPSLTAQANTHNPLRWVIATKQGATLVRGEKGQTAISTPAIRMSLSGLRQSWPDVAFEVVAPVFNDSPASQPYPLAKADLVQLYMRPHRLSPDGAHDSADVLFRLIGAQGRDGGPVQAFAQNGKLTLEVEAVVRKASALRQPADQRGLLAAWSARGGQFDDVRGEMRAGVTHALLTSPNMKLDPQGRIEGEMTFKTTRPLAAIVGLAGVSRGTPEERAAAAVAASALPEDAEGDAAQAIELSVRFDQGRTFIGPFPLLPAPRLF